MVQKRRWGKKVPREIDLLVMLKMDATIDRYAT